MKPLPAARLCITVGTLFLLLREVSGVSGENQEYRPALAGNGPKSLVNLIDTNELMRAGGQDAIVMFDAAIASDHDGWVLRAECRSAPGSDALQKEVAKELQRSLFMPAMVHGRPVSVFFQGSVVFLVRDGRQHLRIFANQERGELAVGNDFIAPQMILGTDDWKGAQPYLEVVRKHWRQGLAVVSLTVDAEGKRKEMHLVREDPTGLNIGAAALKTLSTAEFIPAFRNGHPVASTFQMFQHIYGYRYRR